MIMVIKLILISELVAGTTSIRTELQSLSIVCRTNNLPRTGVTIGTYDGKFLKLELMCREEK